MTRARLRLPLDAAAVAIAAVATAIWLLPASVHIVGWGPTGPARIAFLAPLTRLYVALAAASIGAGATAAAWRASGRSLDRLAPAAFCLGWLLLWLVPFLPWLPDRAPLLLALAGPLRWAVAAVAVAGAAAATVGAADGLTGGPATRVAASRSVVLAVSFVFYAAFGLQSARERGFNGDEPHYLIITHSLYADRDLDIANNHANRDYRSFFGGQLGPDYLRRGLHEEIYSIHAPGLPAALLPAYVVGGAMGAVVFMAALGALTALAIFDLATMVAGRSTATIAWIATCFTVPFVPHAWLIYPELPGALVVAWSAIWLRQPVPSVGRTALHGAALAALPWLHTKFVVLAALVGTFELVKIVRGTGGAGGTGGSRGTGGSGGAPPPLEKSRFTLALALALALPMAISGALWLYSFYRMYGVFDPEAPYGSYVRMFLSVRNIPRGVLGLLFDQKFGILVYSPVYLLAAAGAWFLLRDRHERAWAAQLLAVVVAFLVSTTRIYMWWGGASAPARFLVPLVPLLAPMIAVAICRIESVAGRALVISTVALSLATAGFTLVWSGERLLYSDPHGVARLVAFLQGSAPFDVALPTFTEENWLGPLAALSPWVIAWALVWLTTILVARRRPLKSVFWTSTCAAAGVLIGGSLLGRVRATPDRASTVLRGQLGLMAEYDPSRLRAVDVTHVRRIDDSEVLAAASVSVRPPADRPLFGPVIQGPIELPEGRYEARVWFEGAAEREGDAFVALADQFLIARAQAPLANPVRLSFDLPVGARAFVGLTGPGAAHAVRRVDVAPIAVVPRSARAASPSLTVEPIGGAMPSFMGYLDDHTYPEGGVFWTRNTEKGSVVVVTAGASKLGLILHVGPTGGPVAVDAGGQRIEVDLAPGETRELTVPVPAGAKRLVVSVKAARAFRPAAVDPKSDDQRQLGCQVRPVLS